MNLFKTKFVALLLLTFSLTSCKTDIIKGLTGETITASKNIVEKEFPISENFNAIASSSGWKVELIKSNQPKVVVKTSDNIIPVFRHKIKDGKLSIGFKNNIHVRNPKVQEVKVYYANGLNDFSASSTSSLTSKDEFEERDLTIRGSSSSKIDLRIKAKNTKIHASSSSRINLSGTSLSVNAKASSSSKIHGKALKTKKLEAQTSSSSHLQLSAAEANVKATASSSSKIELFGSARDLNAEASSGAKIIAKELNLSQGAVSAEATSGSTIILRGNSQSFRGDARSGSSIKAKKLTTAFAETSASSGSSISIHVTDELQAETSSGGSIHYLGNPEKKTLNRSGSGGAIRNID